MLTMLVLKWVRKVILIKKLKDFKQKSRNRFFIYWKLKTLQIFFFNNKIVKFFYNKIKINSKISKNSFVHKFIRKLTQNYIKIPLPRQKFHLANHVSLFNLFLIPQQAFLFSNSAFFEFFMHKIISVQNKKKYISTFTFKSRQGVSKKCSRIQTIANMCKLVHSADDDSIECEWKRRK